MHFDKNFGVDTSLVSSSVQFGILKDIIKLIIIIKNPSRNDETKISGIETHTHEKEPIGGKPFLTLHSLYLSATRGTQLWEPASREDAGTAFSLTQRILTNCGLLVFLVASPSAAAG